MKHKICVSVHFITEERKAKILKAAEAAGFEVEFFDNDDAAVGHVGDAEVLYCETPKVPVGAKELKWCQSSYAGIAPYLAPGVLPEDCMLTNGAGSYGVTISEHIIMVTLMMLKRMPEYQEIVRRREWRHDLSIRSIFQSRVTIAGTGNIGKFTANRMKAMGASTVIGVNHSGKCDEPSFDRIITSGHLDEVLPDTDILVMCVPDTPETQGMLSRERIALLPKHAVIVNVGRGTSIDQDALIEALNSGQIAGAALDVMVPEPLPKEHPLWDAKNVIITPHVSGNMTLEFTCDMSVDLFCANLERYAKGEPLKHLVDRKRGY